ncbi:MucB/RseB C-terminal domain-containing protein [Marinobacter sp. 2_MG-2023]|uniref:MucB/RseB C-terminal domain-containing protein n=1 Tax=Marinobacter sp. 2_MG-2023 TaxID=3062679 RepID=UPI0026E1EC47|nr:MucB/RseB C-terminal domain-containing protein [Marinobacter sp. 2_MG-2023]MDO6441091.1 MucB/RseB C-terminal domain-containing protein [Marinobacter sp. 2_MG-2023]
MSKARYFGLCLTDLSLRGLLALALVLAVPAYAVAGEKTAVYWLEKLAPALNMTSYRGVFVYARGASVHSMQIAHRYHDGMVEERLVLQDGGSGEIVRRGVNVVCVLPNQGRVKLDQVIPSGPFAEVFASQLIPVSRWYRAELKGEDRIAGYDVVTVALTAKDQYRYSHRLWLEKSTGLLVKSHVRSSSGEVLEHFQFTSLEITDDISDSEFEIRTEGLEVSRTLSDTDQRAGLQGESAQTPRMQGWQLDWRPEGFEPAAAPITGKGQTVAFSDGLAAFSVFVEPAGRVSMPTGASRVGATTIYMRQLQSGKQMFLVTVVGEIPPAAARQVAESVQIEKTFALSAGEQ